jgi:glyoxylase-like metal-dependent hydrolase (beta-lactamase superfamily II)
MSQTIGRLCDQSSVRRLELDDVTLTYIVDGAMAMVPERFFKSIPASYWHQHRGDLNADGLVPMSAGALLVERGDHRLLIDTGLGPVADDDGTMRANSGDLLKVLAEVGVSTHDIEIVALTHLHRDHTGWAFLEPDSDMVRPTFPQARYLVAARELTSLSGSAAAAANTDRLTDLVGSLRRLLGLGFIADGEEVSPGVTALVTPGHSPGHTSYVVTSRSGARVVVFGDIFHSPAQIGNTGWTSRSDSDPGAVPAGRARVLAELTVAETLGFAFHFGDQPFGRVVADTAGRQTWQPLATTSLLPPPRSLSKSGR